MKADARHSSYRIFGLDLMRVVAIFLVLIAHTSGTFKLHADKWSYTIDKDPVPHMGLFPDGKDLPESMQKAAAALPPGRVWIFGTAGVELFFVLSGFLIGGILIRQVTSSPKYTIAHAGSFLVRRWFRTIPAYWFVLTFFLLLYSLVDGKPITAQLLSYYLFLQNLNHPHPGFFGIAWSLAVEEWFYLLLPLVVFIVTSLFGGVDKIKLLLITFIFFVFSCIVYRAFHIQPVPLGFNFDLEIRKVVLYRLDAIMYGVLAALLVHKRKQDSDILYQILFVAGLSISGVLIALALFMGPVYSATSPSGYVAFFGVILYAALPCAFALLLPLTSRFRMGNNKAVQAVTYLSRISYSVYLVHFYMYYLAQFRRVHFGNYFFASLFYLCYLCCVIFIATLIYYLIEKPFLKIRDKYIPLKTG